MRSAKCLFETPALERNRRLHNMKTQKNVKLKGGGSDMIQKTTLPYNPKQSQKINQREWNSKATDH